MDRMRIVNIYALTLSICGVLVSALLLFLNIKTLGFFALGIAAIFLLAIAANRRKQKNLARLILVINFNSAIYICSTSLGAGSGTPFWFLTAAVLSFAIFDLSERRYLLASSSLSCGLLVFARFTNFHYNVLPTIPMDHFSLTLIAALMISLSIPTALSVIYYIVKENTESLLKIQSYSSELKFRSIFDHGGVGIIFVNLQGQIMECNDRYAEFYRMSKEQLIGKTAADLIAPEDLEENLIGIKKILSGESNYLVAERRIVHADGSVMWCLLNASRITDSSGQAVYIVSILEDITPMKQLQITLTNTSMMAALGEMSSGVAHEINNPLTIIQGNANQLLRFFQSGKINSELIIKKIENIIATSQRIAKIIHGMQSFSRDAEKDPFLPIPVKKLLENVLSLCSERFKTHQIKCELGPVPEVLLECREVQVEQVLLNLLNNAHDAIIHLPSKWIRLEVAIEGLSLQMAVTDSGSGIDPEVVQKIMQPFYTTKEVGKGSGLGLSISKGIVEDHHGTLSYDSSSPHTRFVIELPIQQKKKILSKVA